jgi:acetyl-CoA synthetase
MKALDDYSITNMSAAATHYRMMKNSGKAANSGSISRSCPTRASRSTPRRSTSSTNISVPACSMYGTTEIGVVLVNYPGADDFVVKPGSLGKAVPGRSSKCSGRRDARAPGEVGELMLWRRDRWEPQGLARDRRGRLLLPLRPRRRRDHLGGWTMSAVEIENTMLKHDNVLECA